MYTHVCACVCLFVYVFTYIYQRIVVHLYMYEGCFCSYGSRVSFTCLIRIPDCNITEILPPIFSCPQKQQVQHGCLVLFRFLWDPSWFFRRSLGSSESSGARHSLGGRRCSTSARIRELLCGWATRRGLSLGMAVIYFKYTSNRY